MEGPTPLLELQNVTQAYGTGAKRFVAVSGVSLTIHEGEFVALLGPSGCGKSTLLRIITGLQKPSEGRVLYRGQPLAGVNPHATIVFQTFALFPWLTVQHNVELGLKARGVPKPERRERAIALLDKVGLDGFETAFPRELSGGMRQKVGFARAMAVEPELLCLDEPFSALDVLSAETLRGELLDLWTGGELPTKAILLVTHNIEEAVYMADRIVIMDKDPGRVVRDMKVDLPYPRSQKSASFLSVVDTVYAVLAGRTEAEYVEMGTAPGQPGRTRNLPEIDIAGLAIVLELVSQSPTRSANLYDLARELKLDSDELLKLAEAAELLGFATIDEGDIRVTDLGVEFAEADVTERKQLFAARIRRLPIFEWLLDMLEKEEDHEMQWDDVQDLLEREFPSEEAERNVETVVEWGRYGELLAYDDSREVIYLETPEREEQV
ncbi:MAG TPA: nitrate ABC transporter ATP-binding protein [Armatimonadetes bacterium]|nr:nitrate ABC transporter ATP-binding protein [Armatimonadota bacterium]